MLFYCIFLCESIPGGTSFNNSENIFTVPHWSVGETCLFIFLLMSAPQCSVLGFVAHCTSSLSHIVAAVMGHTFDRSGELSFSDGVLNFSWFQMLHLLHPSGSTPTSSRTRPRRLLLQAPPSSSNAAELVQSVGPQRHSNSCTGTNWGTC